MFGVYQYEDLRFIMMYRIKWKSINTPFKILRKNLSLPIFVLTIGIQKNLLRKS